jgi:Rps23 Pro-64 3,4-dihydroxylase Tpa1-like proline 4-hydroxylase
MNLTEDMQPELLLPNINESKSRFWQSDPYPHIHLDGFFEEQFFNELSSSMRDVEKRKQPTWTSESEIERNKVCFGADDFDDNLKAATNALTSIHFINYLENLLEVQGLIPLTDMKSLSSRSYFHVSSGGAFLGSHVDQSYVSRRYLGKLPFWPKWFHVISVVFYGSKEWQSNYGGHTILFDSTGENQVATVECKPNRANIFLHTSTSFHGVSEMNTDEKRYSIYMDYYLPQKLLPQLKESIVRNGAKCDARYWLHNVTFLPKSKQKIYHHIWNKYVKASNKTV